MLWLLSDERNDAALEAALDALPPGSGFVFRHYHLALRDRRRRFDMLAQRARAAGHCVVLADRVALAEEWGADGAYATAQDIAGVDSRLLALATAHDVEELAAAAAAGAHGVFLSPVFATRSHPEGKALGIDRFHDLARQSSVPVIALGGMTAARAKELQWQRWGAIDGLTRYALT